MKSVFVLCTFLLLAGCATTSDEVENVCAGAADNTACELRRSAWLEDVLRLNAEHDADRRLCEIVAGTVEYDVCEQMEAMTLPPDLAETTSCPGSSVLRRFRALHRQQDMENSCMARLGWSNPLEPGDAELGALRAEYGFAPPTQ